MAQTFSCLDQELPNSKSGQLSLDPCWPQLVKSCPCFPHFKHAFTDWPPSIQHTVTQYIKKQILRSWPPRPCWQAVMCNYRRDAISKAAKRDLWSQQYCWKRADRAKTHVWTLIPKHGSASRNVIIQALLSPECMSEGDGFLHLSSCTKD